MPKRPDWTRPLPRPLIIPGVMKLRTLADVRELVEKHLPADYRQKDTWQHVAAQLAEAAMYLAHWFRSRGRLGGLVIVLQTNSGMRRTYLGKSKNR